MTKDSKNKNKNKNRKESFLETYFAQHKPKFTWLKGKISCYKISKNTKEQKLRSNKKLRLNQFISTETKI